MEEFFSKLGGHLDGLIGLGPAIAEVGAAIAGAFTVGSLIGFTKEAVNLVEAMGKLSEKTGLALSTLNALREQAHAVGVPFDQLNVSLGMFSDKIYNAVRQGGQALQVFRDLGVQLVDANGRMRSTDDVLSSVADKFSKMRDGPQKASAAMELFGRSGRELIPILNEGAAGIERMRATGGIITPAMVADATEFNRAIRELRDQFEVVFLRLARDVLPSLREFVHWLKDGKLAMDLGQFGDFFSLSMKAAIQDVSMFFMKQIDAWMARLSQALSRITNGGKQLLGTAALTATNPSAGIAQLVNLFGEKSFGLGDQLFATQIGKALSGLFGSGGGEDNPFRAQLEKLRAQMHSTAAGQQAFGDLMALGQGVGGVLKGFGSFLTGGGVGGGGGTGQMAPVSEEAKKLMQEVDKLYAESTQSKVRQLEQERDLIKTKIDQEVLDVKQATIEKEKVETAYAAKIKDVKSKEAEAEIEIELAKVQGQRQLIEKDPDVTEAHKKEVLLVLLARENALIEQNIELNRKRLQDPNLSDEAHLQAAKQLQELQLRHSETQRTIGTTSAQGTFGGEFRTVLTELGNQWGTWASQTANAFRSVFESAISSISSGITGLIMGTKTWGQALMQIGTSILTSIVQAIIEMGVRWVMTQLMMAVAGKSIAAGNLAALAPIAAAQSAIWATPATLATIGSYGGAAAAAPGLVAAAIGITQAESAATFAEGGFTGGSEGEPAGIVHGQEFVFSAPDVRRLGMGNLQALASGGGTSFGAGAASGRFERPIHIHTWADTNEGMKRFARTQHGDHWFMDVMKRNRWRIT